MSKLIDLTGQRFGTLLVLKRGENYESPGGQTRARWLCQCNCGRQTLVHSNNLRRNLSTNCGCLRIPVATKRLKEMHPFQKKENHWNWKGGISSERDQIMSTLEYKEWRKAVFKRDKYLCQKCEDNKSGDLNAHHIDGFNNNIELRTKISSGVTLCETCHKNFHHQYGKGNNTKEQFEEFMEK